MHLLARIAEVLPYGAERVILAQIAATQAGADDAFPRLGLSQ